MFKRDHHIKIAAVLQALNNDLLKVNNCFFAGGTAIALANNEFRESTDIDFLVSDLTGYQELRQLLKSGRGLQPILYSGNHLATVSEIRTDQYGIRTMIAAGSTEIKFEIVFEGRITFEKPLPSDQICGVTRLSNSDLVASKLLANSDRWSDDSVFSRDVIDLAMMQFSSEEATSALSKSKSAYKESVERDLLKCIESLANRKHRLETCRLALKMDQIPTAVLWDRIKSLKNRLLVP